MKNWNLSLIVFSRDFFLENFPSLTSSYDVWVELSKKKKKNYNNNNNKNTSFTDIVRYV